VALTDTANDGTGNSNAFVDIAGSATAQINGSVMSVNEAIIFGNDLQGAAQGTVLIQIGAAGSVTSLTSSAIDIVQLASNGPETETIANAGLVQGAAAGIISTAPGTITNNGTIYGGIEGVASTDAVSTDKVALYNHGTISGGTYGVVAVEGHSDSIYNTGAIDGGPGGFAVLSDALTPETLTNYATGTLSGGVRLEGTATVANQGSISGGTALWGVATLTNSGTMDLVNFTDGAAGSSFTNSGLLTGGLSAAGASFVADNLGTIDGFVQLTGAGSKILNSGTIDNSVLLTGGGDHFTNKGLIDGDITFGGTGNFYNGTVGSVTGTIHGAGVDGVYYGGNDGETFDMTASGARLVVGDSGSDTFIFAAAGPAALTNATTIQGGAGTGIDTLEFSNAGTITASALHHVSGIEQIDLANGHNSIALTDALVASASGASLTLLCGSGADTIDASGITNAANKLTIDAGQGKDTIIAGQGTDTFVFTSASQSTGPNCDIISGLNFALDKFDLNGAAVTKIGSAVTGGSLSTATFDTNLATLLGPAHLGADAAVLLTPSAGTLAGHTFLVEDTNGIAGYQAGKDLVFDVTGFKGTLSTGNFI
jgi:hypothetical protein